MIHFRFNKRIVAVGLALIIAANFSALATVYAAATPYVPLAPLPVGPGGTSLTRVTDAGVYIKGLFNLAIGIAAALAIIMIILGGIQYMGTESIGGKGAGKKKIVDAVLGLLLALGSWLILSTINPALVDFNLKIDAITPPAGSTVTTTPDGLYYFYYVADYQTTSEASVTKGPYTTTTLCEDVRAKIQAVATTNNYGRITNCQDKSYLTDYIPVAPTGYTAPPSSIGTTLYCFVVQPFLEKTLTSRRFCYPTPASCENGVAEIELREKEKGSTIINCSPVTI